MFESSGLCQAIFAGGSFELASHGLGDSGKLCEKKREGKAWPPRSAPRRDFTRFLTASGDLSPSKFFFLFSFYFFFLTGRGRSASTCRRPLPAPTNWGTVPAGGRQRCPTAGRGAQPAPPGQQRRGPPGPLPPARAHGGRGGVTASSPGRESRADPAASFTSVGTLCYIASHHTARPHPIGASNRSVSEKFAYAFMPTFWYVFTEIEYNRFVCVYVF